MDQGTRTCPRCVSTLSPCLPRFLFSPAIAYSINVVQLGWRERGRVTFPCAHGHRRGKLLLLLEKNARCMVDKSYVCAKAPPTNVRQGQTEKVITRYIFLFWRMLMLMFDGLDDVSVVIVVHEQVNSCSSYWIFSSFICKKAPHIRF